jgi:hypothetical protein
MNSDQYIRILADTKAFTESAWLIERRIQELGAKEGDPSPIGGATGWRKHDVWESLKTVSHFNLGVALELRLKCLLALHRIEPRKRGTRGHYLRKLLEQLPHELLDRLEALYRQAMAERNVTLLAFISTQRPERPKGPPNRRLDTLRDFCAYLDEDVGLWSKRYAWEQLDGQGKWRHYLTDLDAMLDFLDRSEQLAAELAKEEGLVK